MADLVQHGDLDLAPFRHLLSFFPDLHLTLALLLLYYAI